MSSRLIWFQLLDSTGQPYKGTTADKVSVASLADVADFRVVVKAKYDQPNYLKDIPSSSLLLYNNRDSLEKGLPLEADYLLDGLGKSMKEALIVVVPSFSDSFETKRLCRRYSLESMLAFLKDRFGITMSSLNESNASNNKFPVYSRSRFRFGKTIDREYLFHQILEDFRACISQRSILGSMREKNQLLFVGGGPGSGKTHIMDVLLNGLLEVIESISIDDPLDAYNVLKFRLENCVYVSISFNNEMPISPEESDPLSTRALFSYFVRNNEVLYPYFVLALKEAFGNDFTFAATVQLIKEHKKKEFFFLSVDEIDKVFGVENLRSLFSNICPLWDDPNAGFLFYGSALALGPLSKFQTYSGRNMKIHCLNRLSTSNILFDKEVMNDRVKGALVAACYGHPKSLEFLQDILERLDAKNDCSFNYQTLFTELSSELNSKYKFDTSVLAILRACLCTREAILPETVLPGTDITFSYAIANGFLYNDFGQYSIPFITPLFLYNYLMHMKGSAASFIGKMMIECESGENEMCNFGGERFELFHLCWEALMRFLWPREYMSLLELYKIPSETPVSEKFRKRLNVGSRYAPFRFPGDFKDFLSNKDDLISRYLDSGQPIHFGKGNPGFDIAIFTRSVEKETFAIFIETRFSDEKSKTRDSMPTVNRKYSLIRENYGAILEEKGIQHWVLIYAAYRDLTKNCYSEAIPEDVLVMDIDRLLASYGPSYSTPAL